MRLALGARDRDAVRAAPYVIAIVEAVAIEVERISDGSVRMGPGTLYGTVKRLLELGLAEESGERPDPELDDERRRYYRITGLGEKVLRAEVRRLSTMIERSVLRRLAPRLGEA